MEKLKLIGWFVELLNDRVITQKQFINAIKSLYA